MQFCELLLDELVIALLHWDIPIELALVVGIEYAVIKSVLKFVFFARSHECRYYISLIWAGSNVVVVVCGVP